MKDLVFLHKIYSFHLSPKCTFELWIQLKPAKFLPQIANESQKLPLISMIMLNSTLSCGLKRALQSLKYPSIIGTNWWQVSSIRRSTQYLILYASLITFKDSTHRIKLAMNNRTQDSWFTTVFIQKYELKVMASCLPIEGQARLSPHVDGYCYNSPLKPLIEDGYRVTYMVRMFHPLL